MKATENIFQLIKSLSQTEKRYFKIFALRHVIGEQNDYVHLFEAINKQSEYNEKQLKQLFADKTFVKHFAVVKHYLYELIIKSMRFYHSTATVDERIKGFLSDVVFLFKKGQYGQFYKTLAKAKELAYKYERYTYLLEILDHERALLADFEPIPNKINLQTGELLKEKQRILKKLQKINSYYKVEAELMTFIRQHGTARKKKELDFLKNILKRSSIQEQSHPDSFSFTEQKQYYHIHALAYYLSGNFVKASFYQKKIILLFDENPHYINDKQHTYITALNNLLIYTTYLHDYVIVKEVLKKLKSLHPESKTLQANIFIFAYTAELDMHIHGGTFEKGLKIIPEIKAGIELHQNNIEPIRVFLLYFDICLIYFGNGNYNKSLYWLNKLLNKKESMLREDIYCFARILNLIIHYELEHENLLEYTVKSTYHFLHKRNRLYQFETIILDFIRKEIPSIYSEKELISAFKELKTKLEKVIKENTFEKKALDYFDFISWLESKIKNRPFAEIVREKAKNFIR